MIPAPKPDNEQERQRALDELNILDTLEEQAYDDLTFLASQICETPIALVSLVDRDRQWFKSHLGLGARETPRDYAFCAHVILGDQPLVIKDSSKDERFHDNPLATGAPHVKFYAGAPLILRSNVRIGTLCVIDNHARGLSDTQRQALEAIARQVVALLELRLQLQQRDRLDHLKDDFVSMVNHELRTPLTSIKGSLTLLQNQVTGVLPAHAMSLVEMANRNSDRLLNIVNDILDVSKLEAGKMDMNKKPLGVLAFLQKAMDLNRSYCEGYGCSLALQAADNAEQLTVAGDEQRLLQVMSNLISNAAKFSHTGDTIQVSCQQVNGSVVMAVTDHGPGIPLADQKLLFTKFKQLGNSINTKSPGTGLGLNICKLIVELHGGSIDCESAPGNTTFRFTLAAHQGL